MGVEERIVSRLEELITLGEEVLQTKRSPPRNFVGFDSFIDVGRASQWKMSSLNILHRSFGEDSIHSKEFTEAVDQLTFTPVKKGNNILIAALDDMKGGHLADVRELVEADLFSDFLDQAEHLLSNGYYQAAAVIAGCVLEDALRKLCIQNSIELPDKPKLNSMNDELRKKNVYKLQTHKRITANADLRNKAAHGEWEEFTKEEVKEMMSSIQLFMERYFG